MEIGNLDNGHLIVNLYIKICLSKLVNIGCISQFISDKYPNTACIPDDNSVDRTRYGATFYENVIRYLG